MSHTNLLYHIVFATKERAPLITNDLRLRLHAYLGGTVRGLGGLPIEINGVNDHIHVLVKLPPTSAVSEFIGKLKVEFLRLGQTTNARKIWMAIALRSFYRK